MHENISNLKRSVLVNKLLSSKLWYLTKKNEKDKLYYFHKISKNMLIFNCKMPRKNDSKRNLVTYIKIH